MAKISCKALTEKGVVKTQVRKDLVERETKAFNLNELKGYDRVENKGIFVKEYASENGSVYATWTLTISQNDPTVEKPKATKKKTSSENESFEIVEED